MKKLSELSLQWRVTLLTAVVLIISSVALTAFSMYNAGKMLYPLLENSVTSEVISSDEALNYAAGVPATYAEEKKNRFDLVSILFCATVTVLGTGTAYVLSGRALSPVKNLNKTVRLIDEHNLSERLPQVRQKDEIGQLTDSFNRMLSRLEEAFERQKRFTASAAHELKTPLATVKAGIQVLERDENADLADYKQNAQIIMKSVDRLTSVVNDLLMLASAEEGNQNMSESICLDVMLETITADISVLYEKSNIDCEIDLQENTVTGNAGMLYRALYNLVENAYKYNRQNGKVTVKSFSSSDNIFIEISDTGVGISQEHQPLIFEAFYRVDASRSRKTAGAGLGLSLVKAIAQQHGGTITLESTLGKGSRFTMILPK